MTRKEPGTCEDPYKIALIHAVDPAELRDLEAAIGASIGDTIDNRRARALGHVAAERRAGIYKGQQHDEGS